jgi:hypothetical protein
MANFISYFMDTYLLIRQSLKNMGIQFVLFRFWYEFQKHTKILTLRFKTNPKTIKLFNKKSWENSEVNYLFKNKNSLNIIRNANPQLQKFYEDFIAGKFKYFNSEVFDIGSNYNWITNPTTLKSYPLIHWSKLPDLSNEMGDIKYVWEKSRFSYLISLIRYDYHFQEDLSKLIFDEILSWINHNPVNQGPNWICSQEISIRLLNWTFALHYYQNNPNLTDKIFDKIIQSIYWQVEHVYQNINFSRIAVRNNHAISETLCLYLVGLLWPQMPNSKLWKKAGKKWFEEEINYQIYEDGTFLQFSMNYHRVVVQLMTLAFYISEKNNEKFSSNTYIKAKKSLDFLMICQDELSGKLPNYGSNDGALFFPFSNVDYQNFTPQLNALYYYFENKKYSNLDEDIQWFTNQNIIQPNIVKFRGLFSFNDGGYYIIKEENTLTFLRCGNHKNRPCHADNLHLDIWLNGENMLVDSGTYRYNCEPEIKAYFEGTESHNTLMLGKNDQMQKGGRFMWYYWSNAKFASLTETNENFTFIGAVSVYNHLKKDIIHTRKLVKHKKENKWEISDSISNTYGFEIKQIWNVLKENVETVSLDNIEKLQKKVTNGKYSAYYGKIEESLQVSFSTKKSRISTILTIKTTK